MKLDLKLGTQMTCTDQSSGKLVEIVVNPTTQQVTELVMQKGLLTKQTWVVPLAAVERATTHTLYLNLSSDQLNNYPEYRETDLTEPLAGGPQTTGAALSPALGLGAEPSAPMVRKRLHEGILTGHTVIGSKTAIRTPQGDVGTVDQVVVDAESGRIAHLVMRKGLFPKNFIIPQEAITQISAADVLVTLSNEEISSLPPMQNRQDEEIVADIQRRLQEGWPAFTGVLTTCEAGSVRLSGYVRSKPLWYHAAELTQLVDGVVDVQNDLVVDPNFVTGDEETRVDLARQVHHALITDARTATAVIEVVGDRDRVILQGKVDSDEIRQSAEAIAHQHPGVNGVDNRLTVAQGEAPKLHYAN